MLVFHWFVSAGALVKGARLQVLADVDLRRCVRSSGPWAVADVI